MKTNILILLLLAAPGLLFSQYSVSEATITFYDESRDRNIECGIYYPSVIDTEPGETQFPYIVFGHGFSMNIGPYSFFGDAMAAKGVIVVLPATETGLSPSHETFAKDLAFLSNHFYNETFNEESLFYNSVNNNYFIMGHSMGGGSSHLASSFDVQPLAIISFAAAETNPSAIDAAADFDGKVVMFTGENDNVTPLEEHQLPIFNNSSSSCKTLIEIIGGVHCYFNNYNFNCWFGEVAVGYNSEISREEQQQVVIDFVGMLVESEMYNNPQAHHDFIDSLDNSDRINVIRECGGVFVKKHNHQKNIYVTPNPADNKIYVLRGTEKLSNKYVRIFNTKGVAVFSGKTNNFDGSVNVSTLKNGQYFLETEHGNYNFFIAR